MLGRESYQPLSSEETGHQQGFPEGRWKGRARIMAVCMLLARRNFFHTSITPSAIFPFVISLSATRRLTSRRTTSLPFRRVQS